MVLNVFFLITFCFYSFNAQLNIQPAIKWCTVNPKEQEKCIAMTTAMGYAKVMASYQLQCVPGAGVFQCMEMIAAGQADLATFDMGLGYYGSYLHTLRPIAVENYNPSNRLGDSNLFYEVAVVVPKDEVITLDNLKGRQACFAGVGTAEGWIVPMSHMIMKNILQVTKCNSLIQTLDDFFNSSCAPGSLAEPFNLFGDNGDNSCKLCEAAYDFNHYCSYMDDYAWSHGALQCLDINRYGNVSQRHGRPSLAFVRAGEAERMASIGQFDLSKYQLLCPTVQADGSYIAQFPSNYTGTNYPCSWGTVQSRMIMTSMTRSAESVTHYTNYIRDLTNTFATDTNASLSSGFNLFESFNYSGGFNLLFSDFTKNIYIPPDADTSTYYGWVDKKFMQSVKALDSCPISDVRWCVISQDEMSKCQDMKSGLDAKSIKPEFNCIFGGSTVECMKLIEEGYADMMTLEAADLYVGGSMFNLVPIAAEFYGDGTDYYAVAIAKKLDPFLAVSTLKFRNTCHNGIGKATGWVIPVNMVLETKQIIIHNGNLLHAFSELVSRACIPGTINKEYNVNLFNSLNLCEMCAAGNQWKCERDSRENYFGDSGAFRCLVEGGDVAFAKHTTVRENTGGRNPVEWARNRRSLDYELMCPDGSRSAVENWRGCNLGKIPGNVVVTGGHKSAAEREGLWRLLRYAQGYYSSDMNPVFSMFKSQFGRSDIMFSDSAVSLVPIAPENQNYRIWLQGSFLRQVENLYHLSSFGESGMYNTAPHLRFRIWISFLLSIAVTLLLRTN